MRLQSKEKASSTREPISKTEVTEQPAPLATKCSPSETAGGETEEEEEEEAEEEEDEEEEKEVEDEVEEEAAEEMEEAESSTQPPKKTINSSRFAVTTAACWSQMGRGACNF